jgi:hypothetical protein
MPMAPARMHCEKSLITDTVAKTKHTVNKLAFLRVDK